jgi:hypothetical protein
MSDIFTSITTDCIAATCSVFIISCAGVYLAAEKYLDTEKLK